MSPRHHPSIDTLIAYAAGALAPGFGLVVGAHVEACESCRGQIRAIEAGSGAALARLPDAKMDSGALARVMRRLDVAPAPAPAPDRRSLLERLPLKRRTWVAPGVWVAAVDTPHAQQDRVYLLSLPPGMPTARHGHSGDEFCTVLSGAYRDQFGLFAAGDFAAAGIDHDHQPVVQGSERCLCLFATEGRLRPKGLLARLAFSLANV